MIGTHTINPNKKWQSSGGRKQEVTLAALTCYHKVKSSGPWEVFAEGTQPAWMDTSAVCGCAHTVLQPPPPLR